MVQSLLTLIEKILFLVSNAYKTYLSYIIDILFIYKVYFFAYKNCNTRIFAISK